jgi:hypothetical protein
MSVLPVDSDQQNRVRDLNRFGCVVVDEFAQWEPSVLDALPTSDFVRERAQAEEIDYCRPSRSATSGGIVGSVIRTPVLRA